MTPSPCAGAFVPESLGLLRPAGSGGDRLQSGTQHSASRLIPLCCVRSCAVYTRLRVWGRGEGETTRVLIKTKLLARVYVLFDAPRLTDATCTELCRKRDVDGLSVTLIQD